MSSFIKKRISKKITKALYDFPMIAPGDRVLAAVSGGKDSTVLVSELAARCGKVGVPYTIEAVHIQSDFADQTARQFLKELEQDLKIPFHFLNIAVEGRLKEGKKLNCYWCSTQRRTELIQFAREHHFNKIALGHHLDDIIETLFMNIIYNGEFSGMPPIVPYEKYPVSVIRPLCYCEEQEIQKYIDSIGYEQYTCTCAFSKNSHRKHIRHEIEQLTGSSSALKQNIFESMRHIKMDYLL